MPRDLPELQDAAGDTHRGRHAETAASPLPVVRRVPADPMALPWLYGVARNTVANARRSAARRARLDARIGEHAQYVWHDSSAATEMDAVLERLSDDDREVLMLVAWEGLGPADLGRVLGVSSSAAAVRLHRARSRLSAAWNDSGGAR